MIASRLKMETDCSNKLTEMEEAQKKIEKERNDNVLSKVYFKCLTFKTFYLNLVQQKEIRDIGMRLRSSQTGHFLPSDVS